ncbi:MAG TPA: transcription antitermination factor NusB [Polyangiaceae bacterium]|nr:transcription antitermination factor NusB [Polyangiaceae bacterium]
MGARSSGREAALQMLFAMDLAGTPAPQALKDFWREFPGDAEGRSYAEAIVLGVVSTRDAVDERITRASEHWRLSRMTRVDRNVLRLATWELVHQTTTPRAVILDEAVELAKRFGSEDSGAFVNGVLGRVADDCGRAAEPNPGA